MIEFVPILLVSLLFLATVLAPFSRRVDLAVTRLALGLFGGYAKQREPFNTRQKESLEAAHVADTYRVYASKTFLYASVVAVTGSIVGVYLFVSGHAMLVSSGVTAQLPPPLSILDARPNQFGPARLFVVLLSSSATIGIFGAFGTYQLRWSMLRYVASDRRRRIDTTIKRNVAFIFALSRSGMPFAEVLRVLSRHTSVYGETAREMSVTVKDIDLFGTDLLTAIRRTGDRTPSDELEDFVENLGSVLRSGNSLPEFLRDQYEYFLDEEEAQQRQFLELLGTLAEAYVTVFVAGPLFLITILVIIGLLLGGTLGFLRAMVYLIVPLSTVGFVIYLDSITEDIREEPDDSGGEAVFGRFDDVRTRDEPRGAVTDGGVPRHAKNRFRLAVYRRLRPHLKRFRDPVRVITDEPTTILYLSIPVGAIWIVAGLWPTIVSGDIAVGALDGPIIQALLFVTGTFAITYDVSQRRIKAIESAIPDFLDRLASTNEAGMDIVDSFDRVVHSDLGTLTGELRQTWADIQWGAHVEDALVRFQHRVGTPATTRVVTLTTKAMNATNDIGPVLRIAADEAKATKRLERDRRNELLTYMVVVYMAFFVFLVIVVALDNVFIPSIPTGDQFPSTGPSTGMGLGNLQQLTQSTKDAYSLLFFHAGIVQGYVSGFVAGQMGEGSVKAGAKHATVMLGIAYVVFLVFG